MNLLRMNIMKLKYKNEIVFFFIVVFGFNITNKVEPNLNKFLEKVKNVGDEINIGIKNETSSKLNSFSENNNKATAVSKQDKVPPFSSDEIKNVI